MRKNGVDYMPAIDFLDRDLSNLQDSWSKLSVKARYLSLRRLGDDAHHLYEVVTNKATELEIKRLAALLDKLYALGDVCCAEIN